MTITGAFVLFAMIWFMVFLVMLQIGNRTQADAGEVVPGTPPGAPSGFVVRRKALRTTLIALPLWAVLVAVIMSGAITIRDIDIGGRMGPPPSTAP